MHRLLAVMAIAVLAPAASAECLSIAQASSKIGAMSCVTGKVIKVGEGRTGNFFLDFCEDYRQCAFTVFIPRRSLRDVGDVRQLEGKHVEVHGKIQQYEGRAEIVLTDVRQLRGESARIPPLPKNFDVQRKGHFSAGKFKSPKSHKRTRSRRQPAEKPVDDEDWQ